MRELYTEIRIAAPRERVWQLIVDLAGYERWNPFIIRASGVPSPGHEIRIRMRPPGARAMNYTLKTLALDEGREFRWLGKMGMRGILDGEHIFELRDDGSGGVTLVHREYFRGILVPFVWNAFLNTKLRHGFELMNEHLKNEAEGRMSPPHAAASLTVDSLPRSQPWVDRLAQRAIYFVLRGIQRTLRVRQVNIEARRQAEAHHPSRRAFVMALWHERAIPTVLGLPHQGFRSMTSLSRDGDVAAYVLERFGFCPVRGSSSRGGRAARAESEDWVRAGEPAALTVDGPRGPRHRCKSGAVLIASAAGAAVLPVVVRASREWVLNKTWDKTKIPKPFANLTVIWGRPIFPPPGLEADSQREALQTLCRAVDDELRRIDELADSQGLAD